jgi:mono/diheme cytochrome c family protein
VRWVAVVIAVVAHTAAAAAPAPSTLRGWPLYDRLCLPCHGSYGDGQGPAAAFSWPPPRALSRGEMKWRSTPVGQPATVDDVRATIRFGAPGTSMPAFGAVLGAAQIDDVIDVVRAFAPAAIDARGPAPIALGDPPTRDGARGAVLWREKGCAACHGATGDGRGASTGAGAPPYDLTSGLRRPREADAAAARRAAALSIATGLTGTTMPGYAGTLRDDELWALADHVVALAGGGDDRADHRDHRDRRASPLDRRASSPAMPPAMIDADRAAPYIAGTWPGRGDPDEVAVFGAPIPPQGEPPASLAPAQASLRAQPCARCHAKQFREWDGSLHRGAASPGLLAQIEFDTSPGERAGCLRCHAPLAEQRYNTVLLGDGVSCAGCHVRSWVRRGPPRVAPSLLTLPSYPLVTVDLYERADFCLPCHQLPPRLAVAGRPLLDTYKEWLDGPYMPRGVQCQHCHMPNREHSVLGVHDPQTFRQGIQLTATAHRKGGAVTAVATVTNIGAGHYLPTTPTPAVWLSITLLDARGGPIPGATARTRIGRDIWFDGAWHERADTRIAPGASLTFARAWTAGRTTDATTARIAVEVHPDAFYERFYADKLAGTLAPAQRALYDQALTRARGSHYLAEQRDVPIRR